MANTFKNAAIAATGTSLTDAYTAGSGVTATVIGLTCANVSSTSPILVTIKFYDASYKKYGLGATEVYIFQNSN